ncbi:MAG: C4-type zinc ribbon domain-containing protein [Acidobacteria bacterium]|nr:C4-type zinc ribbon domain-containing protein [Acidobacteriota bacterium]MDW7984443.1 C4-type zinc ribbon domain-containing protein [Acidobacteriota bacterium]
MTTAEQLQWLIQLYHWDSQLAEQVQRLETYPLRLQALQTLRQQVQQKLEEAHQAWRMTRQKREEKEFQVAKLEQHIEHLQSAARQAKSNREYAETLLKIEDVRHRIRQMEDELLEWMEKEDKAFQAWKTLEAEVQAQLRDLDHQVAQVQQEQQALEAQVRRLRAQREAFAHRLPRTLLQIYERIAQNRGGVALAEVRDQVCGACHVQLRPRLYQSLRTMEDLVVCENCQRILFLPEWAQSVPVAE